MKDLMIAGRRYLAVMAAVALTAVSCSEDNDPKPSQSDDNVYVNNWIEQNMQFWYLWNDQLPGSPDKKKEPDQFFESLLSPEDRFSWIQDNYQELLNALKGVTKEAGYEFVLYRDHESSDKVLAQVLYVKPASPASTAGLQRGDIISFINGQQMTISNYRDLIQDLKEDHTIRYRSVDPVTETFSEYKTASLTAVQYTENPNYLDSIFEVDGRKIGYYVYNLFAAGPSTATRVYDQEMDQIFNEFKNRGVTDLVLDLRFNSGGSEASANNLASNIGKGVNDSKIFAKREYNDKVQEAILNDPDLGSDYLSPKFSTKASNIGSQLSNGRVYVLTSSRTASASELVINSLKPYMEVFVIGDTTYGKNVGSISLYEENDRRNEWGMQPIVVKIYNSLNQSDYSHGFIPDVTHPDNSLYLYPLGDTREALLQLAIGQITGSATGGREIIRAGKRRIGHSLDLKRSSYNLVIDQHAGVISN